MRYIDRADAGRRIAEDVAAALPERKEGDRAALVLGVPRGGVIVGAALAPALRAELDVALARKIGAPNNPELAIGAVGESGDAVLDAGLVRRLQVTREYLEGAVESERAELQRRLVTYRGGRPHPDVDGRVVVVVDDGIATGATLRATLKTIRERQPAWLVCAVPVGPADSVRRVAADVDVMVCPLQPRSFRAVGEWYRSFTQTTDAEVIAALEEFRGRQ